MVGSNKPRLATKLLAAQDAEAALSTASVNAIARLSTHYIRRPAPAGQPQVVVTAVAPVVAAARTHDTLPPCQRLFDGFAVSCRS